MRGLVIRSGWKGKVLHRSFLSPKDGVNVFSAMRHVHALDLDRQHHNDRKYLGVCIFLLKMLLRRLVYSPKGFIRWIKNELIGCGWRERARRAVWPPGRLLVPKILTQ